MKKPHRTPPAHLPVPNPPVTVSVAEVKTIDVAIAVIFDPTSRQLLICQRKPDTVLAGYWEFPGGKCDPGETPEACAARESLEETGLTIRILKPLPILEHTYPHASVRLHPFVCEHVSGTLQLLQVADAKWIDPAQLQNYRFPEANTPLIGQLVTGFDALMFCTLTQPAVSFTP